MTYQLSDINQVQPLSLSFAPGQKNLFLKGFWLFSAVSIWFIVTAKADTLSIISALIIAVASLYPSYLWCRDRAKGLPLFPLLAINFLFTHSFPLVSDYLKIQKYSATDHFTASLTTASFLLVATFCWLSYVQKTPLRIIRTKEFNQTQVFSFFIIAFVSRIIYQICFSASYSWLIFFPTSVISVIRALTSITTILGIVTISYLSGRKIFKKSQTIIFLSVILILLFVTGATLYLNNFGLYCLLSLLGWMLGSSKIPWRLLLVFFLIISFLHIGKADTRNYYWNISNSGIKPTEYIEVYQTWINNSLEKIQKSENSIESENIQKRSFLNRTSVIEMLLKVQKETGIEKPYLNGKTYSIIPEILVPRILNPNKIRSATANHMLSIYYGLQNYRQTLKTSIGWGLLQEAYANFGWIGCLGLGIFLGNLYGWITRWSMNSSSLSFRFLVALLFMMLGLKSEITMGIFVSVIFQSLVILSAIRMIFMKTVRVNSQC